MEMNVYKIGVKRGGKVYKVVANRSRAARRFLARNGSKCWVDGAKTYCKKVDTLKSATTEPMFA